MKNLSLNNEYKNFIQKLKNKVRTGRYRAALAVNHELVALYWFIGRHILEKQATTNWGKKLITTLAHDLQNTFPETYGFSKRNIERMCQFAREYPNMEIAAQPVSQLPWGHIILLIQRVRDLKKRNWYIKRTVKNRWSRSTLQGYIQQDLYSAQASNSHKISNFTETLPTKQAMLAQEILKSPYNFDFLGLHDKSHEREIEHASIEHITKFMLELGKGFAFVGQQVPITINEHEFFIDMLFYNLQLQCYVVIELKATKFKPAHTGQLNFYLNAVDNLKRDPNDNPTIGLLLCKSRDKIVAEYALKGINKPIGISEYTLTKALPKKLCDIMPSIKEIESELNDPLH